MVKTWIANIIIKFHNHKVKKMSICFKNISMQNVQQYSNSGIKKNSDIVYCSDYHREPF